MTITDDLNFCLDAILEQAQPNVCSTDANTNTLDGGRILRTEMTKSHFLESTMHHIYSI